MKVLNFFPAVCSIDFYNPFNILKIEELAQRFSDFRVKQLIVDGDNTGISFLMGKAEINEDP